MPDTSARHFVGAMHPRTFIDEFMRTNEGHGAPPRPDFSRVPGTSSVPDMCKAFVSNPLPSPTSPVACVEFVRYKRSKKQKSAQECDSSGHERRKNGSKKSSLRRRLKVSNHGSANHGGPLSSGMARTLPSQLEFDHDRRKGQRKLTSSSRTISPLHSWTSKCTIVMRRTHLPTHEMTNCLTRLLHA